MKASAPERHESERVVATGLGVISPLGAGAEAFATALYEGRSARCASERFGEHVITAEIRAFDPKPWLGATGIRALDRTARLLCVAAHFALQHSGVQTGDGAEIGLVCGTMLGSVHSIASFDFSGLTGGPEYVSPLEFPNTVISSPAGQTAIRFHLRGVNSTVCAGMASGLMAIGYASEFIRLGRSTALLAGGAEELCEESLVGMRKSAAPGDGTDVVPGEGAALFAMESAAQARARGAPLLVEIAGFAASYGLPNGSGPQIAVKAAQAAVEGALHDAGIAPEQIAGIITAANGSRSSAVIEARVLQHVFGKRLAEVPACAPKGALGEGLGSSGAMCALVGAMALERQSLPPTVGLANCEGLSVSSSQQRLTGDSVLLTAFGCDGNHAALVLRRPE